MKRIGLISVLVLRALALGGIHADFAAATRAGQAVGEEAAMAARKRRRKHPYLGRWVVIGTKLDLPYPGAPLSSRYRSSLRSPFLRGGYDLEGSSVAYGIGEWGTSYLAKKSLEDRLQSGRTLPAPVWRQEDFAFVLLLPVDQRGDFRGMPVGGMFRMGFFGGSSQKDENKK